MKYEIANFLFGWMTRPILMWSGWDFIKVICWIYLLYYSISTLKGNEKKRKYEQRYKCAKQAKDWIDYCNNK